MGDRVSAGILLYRRRGDGIEILLGHPGGPYFTNKGDGHWSIPKGEPDPGEVETGADLRAVARREFEEETGSPVPGGLDDLLSLGEITQKGGKRVVAWAAEGDLDPAYAQSNLFSVEWPPRSGMFVDYPEFDEVAWLSPDEARRRIKETQIAFIDRLEAALAARIEPDTA